MFMLIFFQSRYQVHVICMSNTIDQHWVNEWLEYNLDILTVNNQNIKFTCIHLCMGLCAYVYEIKNKHTFLLILQYVQYKQP